MNQYVIRVETPLKYFASMTLQNWLRHEATHPQIAGHEVSTRQTLEDPDFIVEDYSGAHRYYRAGFGVGETEGVRLQVLVRHFNLYEPNEWSVVSVWFMSDIEKGEVIWQRTSSK